MQDWLVVIFRYGWQRLTAMLGGGASIKTPDYEIRAPTTEGVITIMRALHDVPVKSALPGPRKHDPLMATVKAKEPMIVRG
ncbi:MULTISPECIES: hypothetical protein [unclassified Neorhizobium]|uniref:hypothetical protein n=1 Tax=unclassified Neorhizobium TaxID=2629175 RepID=UPI001FF6C729|nr:MULTISPECIES: hypothetical protein [unclassified Neorhizobium]MCJ9668527.1 hypothetical protein [Neorhizobium sp. SHOUNA12B]MCJ9744230.1 hypothetical protein [Neorhizobium sp. SHOUNA12A]